LAASGVGLLVALLALAASGVGLLVALVLGSGASGRVAAALTVLVLAGRRALPVLLVVGPVRGEPVPGGARGVGAVALPGDRADGHGGEQERRREDGEEHHPERDRPPLRRLLV